jgi:hypothetical protein
VGESLMRRYTDNRTWASVRVTPASGTSACVGMIVSLTLDLAFRRLQAGRVARPLVTAINRVAELVDTDSVRLREPAQRDTLVANFRAMVQVPR